MRTVKIKLHLFITIYEKFIITIDEWTYKIDKNEIILPNFDNVLETKMTLYAKF